MTRIVAVWSCLILAVAAAPISASAQRADSVPGPVLLTVAGLHTQALGQLATGPGWGFVAGVTIDGRRRLGLKARLRASFYGSERREVCFSQTVGCSVTVDHRTTAGSFFVGLGPELKVPVGRASVFADAAAGVLGFVTSSSVSGDNENDEPIASSTNHDDWAFAWSAGGGVRFRIGAVVGIELGAHYQRAGEISYLTADQLDEVQADQPVTPFTTEAPMLAFTVGVSVRPLLEVR